MTRTKGVRTRSKCCRNQCIVWPVGNVNILHTVRITHGGIPDEIINLDLSILDIQGRGNEE